MSVLIKGTEMPKDCASCEFCDNYGYCYALHGDSLWDALPSDAERFPDGWINAGCPLIEIPTPHGRLIDADALLEANAYRTGKGILAINAALTVIEAEGEE